MSEHPYKSAPTRAFWSRAVAEGYDPRELYTGPTPLLRRDDVIMSAGSCFASNLVPYLEREGFTYLRTEQPHPLLADLPENLGYRNFTAAYGNIYTARQFLQLIQRATGDFVPAEDRWHVDGVVVDPFRPGLRYPAGSDAEYDALTRQHLAAVLEALQQASVLVFTLGLTEAWRSRRDGAVYPACPGTVAGEFDPQRHEFHNFTVREVTEDMDAVVRRLREINPGLRVILTVSPVPLVATATEGHVVTATVHSKSILRTAAGEVVALHEDVVYFPAYEIVCGPQAPESFFEEDRRNVSTVAVDTVMNALLSHCDVDTRSSGGGTDADTALTGVAQRERIAVGSEASPTLARLSQLVADAECDEAMADDSL
jgi:GSCFA family